MLLLVTYDVNTETLCRKKADCGKWPKNVSTTGQRVQNSVFECVVDEAQAVMLQAKLEALIDPSCDSPPLLPAG